MLKLESFCFSDNAMETLHLSSSELFLSMSQVSVKHMTLEGDLRLNRSACNASWYFLNRLLERSICYLRSTKDKQTNIHKSLDKELEKLTKFRLLIIRAGDFNVDSLKSDQLTQLHVSTITANGFELVESKPTRSMINIIHVLIIVFHNLKKPQFSSSQQ